MFVSKGAMMRTSYSLTRTLAATAGCAAAAAATFAVIPASAAPVGTGTSVGPAGAPFSAQNIGNVNIQLGSFTITCTASAAAGTLPAAPANSSASGPISVSIGAPTLSNCSTSLATIDSVTASGNWTITGQYGSPIGGTLTVPQNGVVVKTSGLASCTVTAAPSGPVSLAGTWTNGTDSASNPSKISVTNGQVPTSVSGSFLCPSGTASLTATYGVRDTASSATPIVVGPASVPTTTTTAPPTTTTTVPPTTTTTVPPTTTTVPPTSSTVPPTTTTAPPTTTTTTGGGAGSSAGDILAGLLGALGVH
ncbi:hypothetical protein [Nocardia stercoris]|uniref:hypothetical protein n=1 Tax=Nocardia stercoris TaxID=2483361 RepID=UPI0018F4601B|nr:hypothetical protein [Nocardia stercoris]